MDAIAQWVTQYGYYAIFSLLVFGIVGLPVPDEWLLTFTGFLIYKNTLHPVPAIMAAFMGSVCGITISYLIGRTLGIYVIKKYGYFFHITEERLNWVHNWFEHFGTWSLVFGYYVPGVRHLTAIAAGTTKLEYYKFAIFAYTGAGLWIATFISIGYFFGDKWNYVLAKIHGHFTLVIALAVALVLGWIVLHIRWKNRAKKKLENQ